jgi:hypothetical protein
MAKKPTSVEIRGFQVGFGDCFLLSFVYGEKDRRHVLIDFGTMGLPKRGKTVIKPSVHMPQVAEEIARLCGGQLTAVVATHRHRDHISGFGTDNATGKSGEVIKRLRPRLVLQPWTEDPSAKQDATTATANSSRSPKSFVAGLAAMQDVAQMVVQTAERNPALLGAQLAKELQFIGQDNVKNLSAVSNLIAMSKRKGSRAVWAHHGSPSGLDRLLPGVKVRVLGPPNLKQSEKIRMQRSRDPDQFWHLLAGASALRGGNALAPGVGRGRGSRRPVPREARWFSDRLQRMRGQQLLEIVTALDKQMNNTSLILLFELFGKKLLFPGDAQIENWSYALEDAPDAEKTRTLLAGVDVYKVGHHGSLNATPKELLWERFAKKKGKKLKTLLSTLPGKHGRVKSRTEVPRKTLVEALNRESKLSNTQGLKLGAKPELCYLVTVVP